MNKPKKLCSVSILFLMCTYNLLTVKSSTIKCGEIKKNEISVYNMFLKKIESNNYYILYKHMIQNQNKCMSIYCIYHLF